MKRALIMSMVAAGLAAGEAAEAAPMFVLSGYSFGGLNDIDTHALSAKFKHQPGARVTKADIAADAAILSHELATRNIKGRLFTTFATKHDELWVIFDVLNNGPAFTADGKVIKTLVAQKFEGQAHMSADALAAASGLKAGEILSREKINAARQAILAAYAKAMPGKTVGLKGKMQNKADGDVTLTWVIDEPH